MKYTRLLIATFLLTSLAAFSAHAQTSDMATSKEDTPVEKEIAVIETNYGTIELEFFREDAPKTVENFVELAKRGYYDGVIFHRVIPGFMIQTGGFDSNMRQRETGNPIKNEADNGLRNLRYTLAMARTGDPSRGAARSARKMPSSRSGTS